MRYWLVVFGVLLGCGDDPPPALPDFGMEDMGSENDLMPDTDAQPDLPPTAGCANIKDLGIVTNNLVVEELFSAPSTGHQTTCQGAETSSGSALFQFEVQEKARLSLIVDPRPILVGEIVIPPQPTVELREGICASEDAVLGCQQERSSSYELEPGTPYFLAINGDLNSNGARIQFRLVDVVCDETDNRCVGDNQLLCIGGLRIEELPCAAPCVSDTECGGNACSSPIVIEPTGVHRVTGTRAAYTDNWSADVSETCSIEPGEPTSGTPFSDLVLHFPNVPAETSIRVSAENDDNSGSYAFFFSSECDANSCLAAGGFDAFGFNEFDYTTTASGDVFLRIESLGPGDRTFAIDLSFE